MCFRYWIQLRESIYLILGQRFLKNFLFCTIVVTQQYTLFFTPRTQLQIILFHVCRSLVLREIKCSHYRNEYNKFSNASVKLTFAVYCFQWSRLSSQDLFLLITKLKLSDFNNLTSSSVRDLLPHPQALLRWRKHQRFNCQSSWWRLSYDPLC